MKIEITTMNAIYEAPVWDSDEQCGEVILYFGNVEITRWKVDRDGFAYQEMEDDFVADFIAEKLRQLFKEI